MKFSKRLSLRSGNYNNSNKQNNNNSSKETTVVPCELSLEHSQLAAPSSALSSASSSDCIISPSPRCCYPAIVVPLRTTVMASGRLNASGKVQDLFPRSTVATSCTASTTSPRSIITQKANSFCCCTENHEDDLLDGANLHHAYYKRSSSSASLISRATPVVFKRTLSSFLRVADLEMDETLSVHSSSSLSDQEVVVASAAVAAVAAVTAEGEGSTATKGAAPPLESVPNFHHISVDPPPGIAVDPKERWVVLDNGVDGTHAPLAPLAVRALAKSGLTSMYDATMWTPADGKTTKFLTKKPDAWPVCTWQRDGVVQLPSSSSTNTNGSCAADDEQEIMVWSGSFKHGLYGSELPAIRSAGMIDMSPQALCDLLVDSNRIAEYNKLSLGRTDLLVLQADMNKDGPFGGVTKVVKAVTKPPLVRKALVFTSIIHVRELDDGSGFKIVTRAVTPPEEQAMETDNASSSTSGGNNNNSLSSASLANAMHSEILLGVNIIKRIEGDDNRCLMMCVNHIRSPMVPMMIAKRIGLSAAINFYHDLRACC